MVPRVTPRTAGWLTRRACYSAPLPGSGAGTGEAEMVKVGEIHADGLREVDRLQDDIRDRIVSTLKGLEEAGANRRQRWCFVRDCQPVITGGVVEWLEGRAKRLEASESP